jgi:hypothetical protein
VRASSLRATDAVSSLGIVSGVSPSPAVPDERRAVSSFGAAAGPAPALDEGEIVVPRDPATATEGRLKACNLLRASSLLDTEAVSSLFIAMG